MKLYSNRTKKITGQDTLQIHQGKYQLSDIQKSRDIQPRDTRWYLALFLAFFFFFLVKSGSLHFTNFLPNDHKDVRLHTEESNDGC